MGEYVRQEPHNENIYQEYNCDYVVRRHTELTYMKEVNNLAAVKGNY